VAFIAPLFVGNSVADHHQVCAGRLYGALRVAYRDDGVNVVTIARRVQSHGKQPYLVDRHFP